MNSFLLQASLLTVASLPRVPFSLVARRLYWCLPFATDGEHPGSTELEKRIRRQRLRDFNIVDGLVALSSRTPEDLDKARNSLIKAAVASNRDEWVLLRLHLYAAKRLPDHKEMDVGKT